MVLRRKRSSKSGAASAVLMTVLLAVVVFGIGTGVLAKEKVTTISAYVITFEKVDGIFGVYPNELNVANGDVIKYINTTEVVVVFTIPDSNLFVNEEDETIPGGTSIKIDPGKTRILNVSEGANSTKAEIAHTLDVTFGPATEQVKARPRIIVQPN